MKSHTKIFTYYIGYVTIKDFKNVKLNSVNPLYLIFNKLNRYFDEFNGNKYLTRMLGIKEFLAWQYLLELFFFKTTNIIHKFSWMNFCVNYRRGKKNSYYEF